jgi:hypothetical protein
VKLCSVQILVEVAITQMRFLRAEVDKGFTITEIGRELVGPKQQVNCV